MEDLSEMLEIGGTVANLGDIDEDINSVHMYTCSRYYRSIYLT